MSDAQHTNAAADATGDPAVRRRSALYAGIGVAVGLAGGLVGGAIAGDSTYWAGAGIAVGAGTGVAVANHGWLGRRQSAEEAPPA